MLSFLFQIAQVELCRNNQVQLFQYLLRSLRTLSNHEDRFLLRVVWRYRQPSEQLHRGAVFEELSSCASLSDEVTVTKRFSEGL